MEKPYHFYGGSPEGRQKNKNFTKGFTLVEIMVATSIFMMIMLVSLGALITSSDVAKKAQAMRTAMDNISFAMESMTRSLRMGTDYTCILTPPLILPVSGSTPNCSISSSGGIAIAFTPALSTSPRSAAYVIKDRANGTKVLQRCNSGALCVDIVSPEVDIQKLTFFVNGGYSPTNLPDDLTQPSVYILLKGTVTIKGQPTVFAIQTNVSQRTSE